MKRTRSLTATAYHEAAHAVVAHGNGIKFRRITIEKDGDSLGHVLIHRLPKWFQPDVNAGDRARLLAEKRILVKFAGHAAEAKYRGRANRIGASSDYRQAIDFILPFTGNKKEAGLYLTWLAEKQAALSRLRTTGLLSRRWRRHSWSFAA